MTLNKEIEPNNIRIILLISYVLSIHGVLTIKNVLLVKHGPINVLSIKVNIYSKTIRNIIISDIS